MKASHIATWICIACCQVHAQYAVVISEATWNDPAWRHVAQSLKTKHNGSVFIYAGPPFPADLKENLSESQPTHVCFVAIPEEVTVALVRGCHQLLRDLDDDPYGDAIWGIVTGINADHAAHLVSKHGPVTIRSALLKTAGNYLNYLFSGQYHCEGGDPHELWTRINGGTVIKGFDSESDDTVPFVNLLNSNAVDLFVTSGHASECLWQLHHPTIAPEGHFYAVDGRLFGLDAGENSHSIETTNDKVYWAPGNCRIAHASGGLKTD